MSLIDPEPPRPGGLDTAFVLVKLALAVVGGGSDIGSFSDSFFHFLQLPLSMRNTEWLRHLAEAVVELQEKMDGFSEEALMQNELFISTILNATSIALRTHRQEKLKALRHAVANSILLPEIDEDQQAMFLNYLDVLTPWHLKVMDVFDDPDAHFLKRGSERWFDKKNGTLWSRSKNTQIFLALAFPELESEHQFRSQLLFDLGVRQLISVRQIPQTLPDIGPYTTMTGRKFLEFIGARLKHRGPNVGERNPDSPT